MAGTSGAVGLRSFEVTAMARTVPPCDCGQAKVMLSKARWMCPPTSAFMISLDERNGMWVIGAPMRLEMISAGMWFEAPIPEEP